MGLISNSPRKTPSEIEKEVDKAKRALHSIQDEYDSIRAESDLYAYDGYESWRNDFLKQEFHRLSRAVVMLHNEGADQQRIDRAIGQCNQVDAMMRGREELDAKMEKVAARREATRLKISTLIGELEKSKESHV